MNFYIINIFHEAACPFCTAILEKGFEVCAVGIRELETCIEDEIEVWMNFGRNANVTYKTFDEFIQNKPIHESSKILYFPFQQERHLELVKKMDEWHCMCYVVSDIGDVSEERKERYIFIPNDYEKFINECLEL